MAKIRKLIVFLVIAQLLVPLVVFAALDTLTLNGEGANTDGTYDGLAHDYTNLNSDDDDTSYLEFFGDTYWRTYYHSWEATNTAVTSTINNIKIYYKARRNALLGSVYKITPYVNISGTPYYGTEQTLDGTYTLYSSTWTTNPLTGDPWTPATINSAQFGLKMVLALADPAQYLRITYMYVVVDYSDSLPTTNSDPATSNGCGGATFFATLWGNVTDDGGLTIDARGFAWGTTSNATTTPTSTENPENNITYTTNQTTYGSYGEVPFSSNITTFAACTPYFFRAYSHNSLGWSWGDEETFTTLCAPTITTEAPIYVTATTARLKALVTYDGGQPADVRFAYGTASGNCSSGVACTTGTCNSTSYTIVTDWVLDTYTTTGPAPYVDIAGLTPGATYYVCAQIQNDYACRCGTEVSFVAVGAVEEPEAMVGIPTATTVSLKWAKGAGSTRTMVRYKLNGYPSSPTGADGSIQVYFDTDSSVSHTGLTKGTNYYYMAWGESGGTYSVPAAGITGNITLMVTTIAIAAGYDDQPTPKTPTSWFMATDYTKQSGNPIYGIVNFWADSFGMERNTIWFLCALLGAVALGTIFYWLSKGKMVLGIAGMCAGIGLGVMGGIMSLWMLLPAILLAFAAVVIGERM